MKRRIAILGAALLALTGCQSSNQAPPTAEWIAYMQSSAEPSSVVLAAKSEDSEAIRQRHLVEAAIDRCNKSDRIEEMYPGWRDWADYRLVRTDGAATVSLPNQQFGALYVFQFDRNSGRLAESKELSVHYLRESERDPKQSKEPTAGEAIFELSMISLERGAGDWVLLKPAPEDGEITRQRRLVEVAIRGAQWANWLDRADSTWRDSMIYQFSVQGLNLDIRVQSTPSGVGVSYSYSFDVRTRLLVNSTRSIACPLPSRAGRD